MTNLAKLNISAVAVALALPGAAFADMHEPAAMTSGRVSAEQIDNLMRSSNLIGGVVYTTVGDFVITNEEWVETETYTEVNGEWETLGTVEDVVLSRDGQLTGFVVEDMGFLGFGDDSVLLEMSSLKMVDDGSGDIAWVTNITEQQFEGMPEVEENWY